MPQKCLCIEKKAVAPLYHQKNIRREKLHKICSWDYNLLSASRSDVYKKSIGTA
jgi:hypothetical protein